MNSVIQPLDYKHSIFESKSSRQIKEDSVNAYLIMHEHVFLELMAFSMSMPQVSSDI